MIRDDQLLVTGSRPTAGVATGDCIGGNPTDLLPTTTPATCLVLQSSLVMFADVHNVTRTTQRRPGRSSVHSHAVCVPRPRAAAVQIYDGRSEVNVEQVRAADGAYIRHLDSGVPSDRTERGNLIHLIRILYVSRHGVARIWFQHVSLSRVR